jgi:hypothetical protein
MSKRAKLNLTALVYQRLLSNQLSLCKPAYTCLVTISNDRNSKVEAENAGIQPVASASTLHLGNNDSSGTNPQSI